MRSGVVWIIVGFVIGFIGALIPVLGWPLILVGAIVAIIGWVKLFWGAGKKAVGATAGGVKAVSNVAKTTTKRGRGSGVL